MRLSRVSFRGLTRFTSADPVSVDFEALGPGLVAVVGRNGEGKSTTLEAVPAALYKQFPTRPGSLYDHTHGTDAFIEAWFLDDGHTVTVRLNIDAAKRTTEGYVFVDQEPVTSGRADEFEAAIERIFGSREMFLASVFSAQDKAGNFLTMRRGDRKALFVELLQLGALEALAGAARERRVRTEGGLQEVRTTVRAGEQEIVEREAVREQLTQQELAFAQAGRILDDSRAAEARAAEAKAKLDASADHLAALRVVVHATQRELTAALERLVAAKARPAALKNAHTEAVARVDLSAVTGALEDCLGRREDFLREHAEARAATEKRLEGAPPHDDRLSRQVAELGAARAAAVQIRARWAEAKAGVFLQRATASALIPALERVAALAGEVPCHGVADLPERCQLLENARTAREKLATLRSELRAAEARLEELAGVEPPEPETLDGELSDAREAERAMVKADADRRALSECEAERTRTLETYADIAARYEKTIETAKATLAQLETTYEADLFSATEMIDAAEKLRDEGAAQDVIAREVLDRALLDQVEAAREAALHPAAKAKRELAEAGAADHQAQVTTLIEKLRHLDARAAQLARLKAGAAEAEAHLGDWSLLERSLGKDGVQALEIDAAGPEVARLTNELLAACYGPRFSIVFETLREKRDGTMAEAFEVVVHDGPVARPVEALSGGERVIIGEAVSLSVAIFNSRKNAIRWETYFRDETAGALDRENADHYVAMLRRARELAGAFQIIFVSHSPEVYEAADIRLIVEGGRIRADGARVAA